MHGFIPSNCLTTMLVPVSKSSVKDVRDPNNYRPIALASVISKLFERIILDSTIGLLSTCDNQFGFKAKHGTDLCVFVLKQIVAYYNERGSPVFSVFVDSSKAFDRVSHNILFDKLIERNVSLCFVRLLSFWYVRQRMVVKWGNCFSTYFSVSNGVRQGGILSPYLYAVYIDELSSALNKITAGCYVGNHKINHLMFADDLCCFSPSVKGLRKMLQLCEKYALTHAIKFNPNKTAGMLFPSPTLKLNFQPNINLDGCAVKFVSDVKYLGVCLNQHGKDDADINR